MVSVKSVVRRRVTVTAISEDTAVKLLQKLNLYSDVINGSAHCYICGGRITLESIGGVMMIDEKPVLICDKPSCIARASLLSKEKH